MGVSCLPHDLGGPPATGALLAQPTFALWAVGRSTSAAVFDYLPLFCKSGDAPLLSPTKGKVSGIKLRAIWRAERHPTYRSDASDTPVQKEQPASRPVKSKQIPINIA